MIFLFGGLGTLARYGVCFLLPRTASGFAWGTVAVNVAGCALFGFLLALGSGKLGLSAEMKAIILVGFMGAFTTFSTYISDTSSMLAGSAMWLALGNIALQNVFGLIAFALGMKLSAAI